MNTSRQYCILVSNDTLFQGIQPITYTESTPGGPLVQIPWNGHAIMMGNKISESMPVYNAIFNKQHIVAQWSRPTKDILEE